MWIISWFASCFRAWDVLLTKRELGLQQNWHSLVLWVKARMHERNQWPNSTYYSHDCSGNGVEMDSGHVNSIYTSRLGSQLNLIFISFKLWFKKKDSEDFKDSHMTVMRGEICSFFGKQNKPLFCQGTNIKLGRHLSSTNITSNTLSFHPLPFWSHVMC